MRLTLLLASSLLAISAFTASASAQDLTPVTVSTGWVVNGGTGAALVIADDRGYFEEGGVDVDVVRGFGSADVVAKVAAGTYQAGTGSLPALVQAVAENPDLDAIAVMISYDASSDAVVGPLATGISKPTDLAGRKLSAQPNSTTKLIFEPFAKAVGLDKDSIEWVEVGPELVAVVVQQGQADGVAQFAATAISNFARLGIPEDQLYQFKFADHIDNLYGNGLILQKSWAEANPEAAAAVVRAYALGLKDAYADPEAAIDAVMAREPLLNREVELGDLNYSNNNYFFTPNVLEKGLAYHTAEDVQAFIGLLVEPFGLSRTPDASEVYTDAYLPDLAARQVAQ